MQQKPIPIAMRLLTQRTPYIEGHKLRWDATVSEDQAVFSLYVPKWRVPNPWPEWIYVTIEAAGTRRGNGFSAVEDPIAVVLAEYQDKTRTVRYQPIEDKESWQVSDTYVPYSLLPSESPERILIRVNWNWAQVVAHQNKERKTVS